MIATGRNKIEPFPNEKEKVNADYVDVGGIEDRRLERKSKIEARCRWGLVLDDGKLMLSVQVWSGNDR